MRILPAYEVCLSAAAEVARQGAVLGVVGLAHLILVGSQVACVLRTPAIFDAPSSISVYLHVSEPAGAAAGQRYFQSGDGIRAPLAAGRD
jgi:hypothetical protein